MSSDISRIDAEKRALREAREKGTLAVLGTYLKFSGPGWLLGAITLGGGSLAGSLYLGVIGGFSFLWLQVLAMIMGVILLSAITFVTLSTGLRPFRAINEYVNPVLGWGWAIATIMASIVWCLPQFSLGTAAVKQNLLGDVTAESPWFAGDGGTLLVCLVILGLATVVIWFYDSGHKGIRIFEWILKGMVALIVLCFFGVVIRLLFSAEGLPIGEIVRGFIPDPTLFTRPADGFAEPLVATGGFAAFWSQLIVSDQRDIMITAAATAVGINMTFLLPYAMLRKGWDRDSRGLAIFDLGSGLFIPFVLATGCVVIAAASQFHTRPQAGVIEGNAPPAMLAQYERLLTSRLQAEAGPDAVAAMSAEEKAAAIAGLPRADKEMGAMLVRRDAFALAGALERLTGRTFSHYVFGIGVVAMALSTIIILMLITGFTICEMFNLPLGGMHHRLACLVAGLGVLGPFIWKGQVYFWLSVPTSVFGMMLLPIAALTFFLMLNNRALMGKELLRGGKRIAFNALVLVALTYATLGAAWSIWSRTQIMPGLGIEVRWVAIGLVVLFVSAAVMVHFVRPPKTARPIEAEREAVSR